MANLLELMKSKILVRSYIVRCQLTCLLYFVGSFIFVISCVCVDELLCFTTCRWCRVITYRSRPGVVVAGAWPSGKRGPLGMTGPGFTAIVSLTEIACRCHIEEINEKLRPAGNRGWKMHLLVLMMFFYTYSL